MYTCYIEGLEAVLMAWTIVEPVAPDTGTEALWKPKYGVCLSVAFGLVWLECI